MAQLVREIMIEATPETIWPFLTEPDALVQWHGSVAEIDPRPGGIYRVFVAGQFQSAGEYVEVVPMEKVVFTFGWEEDADLPPGASTVTVTLTPVDGGTEVRLVHDGLTDDQAVHHAEGGTTSLAGWWPQVATAMQVRTNGWRHRIHSTNCRAPRRHWRCCSTCCGASIPPT